MWVKCVDCGVGLERVRVRRGCRCNPCKQRAYRRRRAGRLEVREWVREEDQLAGDLMVWFGQRHPAAYRDMLDIMGALRIAWHRRGVR